MIPLYQCYRMVSSSPVKRPLSQTKLADGISLPDWLKWLLLIVASYFQFHGWHIALWSKVEMSYLCQDRGSSFNSSYNIELTVPMCRVENEVSKSKGQTLYSLHSCCHRHWCYWCSTVCQLEINRQANWQPCKIRFLSWLSVTMYMQTQYIKGRQLSCSSATTATKVGHICVSASLYLSYFSCLLLTAVCLWKCSLSLFDSLSWFIRLFPLTYFKITESMIHFPNATAFWAKVDHLIWLWNLTHQSTFSTWFIKTSVYHL